MDTISQADGIYGNLPVKVIANNNCINSGHRIPPVIGGGLTVEQFVSSHLAADYDPSVKDELCRAVNNFCTNANSLLSMFAGSFLKDFSGLIPSLSNNIPEVREKPSHASSQANHSDLEDESSDEYYTEDQTSVEDTISDNASEDEPGDENTSLDSYSDDDGSHDDASEESDDPHTSLDASGSELAHEQDGDDHNDLCKKEVPGELFQEIAVPPGYPDVPGLKHEP